MSRRAVRRELADLLPDAGEEATSLPVSNLLAGESLRLGEAEVCSSCGGTTTPLGGGHRASCRNRGW
jgi:hypothetical protein